MSFYLLITQDDQNSRWRSHETPNDLFEAFRELSRLRQQFHKGHAQLIHITPDFALTPNEAVEKFNAGLGRYPFIGAGRASL